MHGCAGVDCYTSGDSTNRADGRGPGREMLPMTRLPGTDAVLKAGREAGLVVSPAELHGALAGWLAGGGEDVPAWPARVMADDALPEPARDGTLDRLRQATRAQLDDGEFGFDLLLAPADAPLPQRAEALFEWCRGFLGGFGLAGAGAHAQLSDDAQEVLRDFGTIAASAFDFGDAAEDEDALIEVHEFLRVGALLLYTEAAGRGQSGSDRLH